MDFGILWCTFEMCYNQPENYRIMKNSRRDFIEKSVAFTSALSLAGLSNCTGIEKKNENEHKKAVKWPVAEGPDTPKLCVGGSTGQTHKKSLSGLFVFVLKFQFREVSSEFQSQNVKLRT